MAVLLAVPLSLILIRLYRLFDSVAERWRFRGDVAMIAGSDLAARTIDPDDTLAFLSGELRARFVQGPQDLEDRLQRMDEAPDPDGRFRVAEFYCHDNTWSGTLAALLTRSDVILMDLRGFSERNSGCVFELRQLAAGQRPAHTVFVVDGATDLRLLEATAGTPLRLERVAADRAAARERVYRSLCRA